MTSLSAKKRIVALCVADDPVMTRNIISNLVQAAGQTVSLLEKQLGKYSEMDSEERLWEEFLEHMSEDWVSARRRMDDARAAAAVFSDPQHQPLGLIGQSLDAPFIDAAQEKYRAAQQAFHAIDERLRKCDITCRKYDMISREFNSAQKKKTYIKKIRNALGMIEGAMDLSQQIALEDTLSIQLPSFHEAEPPSDADLERLAVTLHQLVSCMLPLQQPPSMSPPTEPALEKTGWLQKLKHIFG